MRVVMDRVGRVVLPKQIRDQLGLVANAELEVIVDGTAIRLQPATRPARQIREVDGWPALEAIPGRTMTGHDVQQLRDDGQR